eukprot:2615247-Amphidinium_carterae.2
MLLSEQHGIPLSQITTDHPVFPWDGQARCINSQQIPIGSRWTVKGLGIRSTSQQSLRLERPVSACTFQKALVLLVVLFLGYHPGFGAYLSKNLSTSGVLLRS